MAVFRGDFLPEHYEEVKITVELIGSNEVVVYRIAISHELNIDIPCRNIKFILNDSKLKGLIR